MQKKIAPFGKPLNDLITSGNKPDNSVYLFMGENAWEKGRGSAVSRPTRTLILPPQESPHYYHWPVKDCDILIFDTSNSYESRVEELVACLFKDGAEIVRYVSSDFKLTVFKKDF